ncbi:MAG TPA: hypothetical protein VJK05_02115 [archaeon]|nr:hypothetical protein [archaeon]
MARTPPHGKSHGQTPHEPEKPSEPQFRRKKPVYQGIHAVNEILESVRRVNGLITKVKLAFEKVNSIKELPDEIEQNFIIYLTGAEAAKIKIKDRKEITSDNLSEIQQSLVQLNALRNEIEFKIEKELNPMLKAIKEKQIDPYNEETREHLSNILDEIMSKTLYFALRFSEYKSP